MPDIKIVQLPDTDLSFISGSTLFAVEHPCDRVFYRASGDQIAKQLINDNSRLYGFNKLTSQDRLNLCDIAWYLKGMKNMPDFPFTDQMHSLERAILAIGDKVRHDDKK